MKMRVSWKGKQALLLPLPLPASTFPSNNSPLVLFWQFLNSVNDRNILAPVPSESQGRNNCNYCCRTARFRTPETEAETVKN